MTGNKNRPSGSRKLQSLQAASNDSETDNMYGRDGEIAGRKRSFVDYSWIIVLWTSSRQKDDNRCTFWRRKLHRRYIAIAMIFFTVDYRDLLINDHN